jgi:AcrR family transcriptional regulator
MAAACGSLFAARAAVGGVGNDHVAQKKKAEIREAILQVAYRLFAERGYSNTNIPQIARAVGVSPANIYVYFRSKLDILFSLYDPWLMRHLDALERSLAGVRTPAGRLKKILTALWREMPAADNGFANNMMQAFSTTTVRHGYSPALRLAVEKRLAELIERAIPELGRAGARDLGDIVLMAYDGYVLNFHLHAKNTCPSRRIDFFVDMALRRAGSRRRARKPRRPSDALASAIDSAPIPNNIR